MDDSPQNKTAPNWADIDEQIQCPLCDYNLRGLVEPRCPECGFRFNWPELLDPTLRLHPYIFEHHPERNVWSFWRTLRGTLRPKRFWTSLHPAQPSSVKRLVLYILVVAGITFALGFSATVVPLAVELARQLPMWRQSELQMLRHPRNTVWVASVIQEYGSLDDYLDANVPEPFTWGYLSLLFSDYPEIVQVGTWMMLYVSWPLLSFGALMIFQWSMRRAKVNRKHIWRCAAYSFDVAIWVGIIAMTSLPFVLIAGFLSATFAYYSGILILAVVSLLVMVYRLCVAFRTYLRFDHPVSTVLASQVIVGLVAFNILLVDILW